MPIQSPADAIYRILCVDDDVVATTLRAEILREQGYSVISFHCPFKALESDLTAVDLAVLDFHMPGMNGRQLLLRMRALGFPYPIILLTGCLELLSIEDRVLFSRCIDKGEPVQGLLDNIWKFLDPNEKPDWGRHK